MNLKEHHHGSTLLLAFPQEMLQAHPGENSEHGPARPAAPSHSTAAMGTGPGAAAGRQRCHSPDVPNPASFPSFFGFAAKHSEPMSATCIEAQKNPADCSRRGFGPFATGIRIAYKRKRNGFDAKLKKKKKSLKMRVELLQALTGIAYMCAPAFYSYLLAASPAAPGRGGRHTVARTAPRNHKPSSFS